MREDETTEHRDHERVGATRNKPIDPSLKAAAQRKLSPEDLVLPENEEQNPDCDPEVCKRCGIGVDACGWRGLNLGIHAVRAA